MRPQVPITRPALGDEEAEAVARVVRSGWLMQGPEVAAFETEFAAAVGAAHAVAVSSGTAALELALRALGIGPGDEVVTVSHSFIATANSVRYCGAVPVFVDIDPATYNMDPKLLEAVITPRTRAIIPVHLHGLMAERYSGAELRAYGLRGFLLGQYDRVMGAETRVQLDLARRSTTMNAFGSVIGGLVPNIN